MGTPIQHVIFLSAWMIRTVWRKQHDREGQADESSVLREGSKLIFTMNYRRNNDNEGMDICTAFADITVI